MERKYRWTDNVTKCRTFPIDLSCPTNIDVPLVDLGHQKKYRSASGYSFEWVMLISNGRCIPETKKKIIAF